MDQSPPKRVTRARAAAKTIDTNPDTGIKTARIATAASRAKITRAASTTKRKTRVEDLDGDDELQHPNPQSQPEEIIEPEPKTTRGRSKRNAQPEPESQGEGEPEAEMNQVPVRPARGRPRKGAVVDTPASEPVRATRGRAKRVETPAEDPGLVNEEASKRSTRARAPTALLSKAAAPKKSVKFEEPDKENILPIDARGKAKGAPAAGLRAKPVRKSGATTTARATRGRAKEPVEEKSSPLSPKKATQVRRVKDAVSEDELATTEKTPMKPLMKSPVKPAGGVFAAAKKLEFSTSTPMTAKRATAQDFRGTIIASPPRRPLQSPFKETITASAIKSNTMGSSMFQAPFKPSLSAPTSVHENTTFKTSLLQSPARRPPSPAKCLTDSSPTRSTSNGALLAETPKMSTFKVSRFATPRTINQSIIRAVMGPPSLPISTGSPGVSDDASENTMMAAEPGLSFSGRLSSIMPREADPALRTSGTTEEVVALPKTVDAGVEMIMPVPDNEQAEEAVACEENDTIAEEELVPAEEVGTRAGEEVVPVKQLDTMIVNDLVDHTASPTAQASRNGLEVSNAFALRDASPFDDSDSEDELASGSANYSLRPITGLNSSSSLATPSPFHAIAKTPKTARRPASANKIGFTPLARQLSDWMAASPEKSDVEQDVEDLDDKDDEDDTPKPSPVRSTFFEDEMSIRDGLSAEAEVVGEEPDILKDHFEPVQLDEEDLALAFEADEMSMLSPDGVEAHDEELFDDSAADELHAELAFADVTLTFVNPFPAAEQNIQEQEPMAISHAPEIVPKPAFESNMNHSAMVHQPQELGSTPTKPEAQLADMEENYEAESPESALSEASQEYGDENAIPTDPQLRSLPVTQTPVSRAFVTPKPKRVLGERVCHTVSKVPLKAAAEDSPMRTSHVTRSASISKLPSQRPTSKLSRSNTVISYSPSKTTPKAQLRKQSEDAVMQDSFATPSQAAAWSHMGTPARTPRRDLNTSLLKGAVVFVDVHTSEGADASALFTELLTQMGARCVKSWSWNGNHEDTSKIGITHVVFKDGGKRTLEKAKETNGVVSCVGVGWVLDCERENKWLDESAYSVDTQNVPRGGGRRRKSMEPRALAKMNGELLSAATPNRNMSPTKEFLHFPDTPVTSKSRRRESVQWVRSPAPSSPDDETLILSPVPATPAPETISAYGEDGLYGEDTPIGQTPYYLQNAELVQKTAPAGRRYVDTEQDGEDTSRTGMHAGFLSEKKDESVMMRLMAARRKSLQWAPKVGSPLAKGSLL